MDIYYPAVRLLVYAIFALLLQCIPGAGSEMMRSLGCSEQANSTQCLTVYSAPSIGREEARKCCIAMNSTLATIPNQEVSHLLNTSAVGHAWMGLTLSTHTNEVFKWKSVKPSTEADRLLLRHLSNASVPSCLTFARDFGFRAEPCTERHGFFCSLTSQRPSSYEGCVANGTCYIMVNSTAASWYGARSYCRTHHGGDLLALQVNISDAVNATTEKLGSSKFKLWMGASNAMWNWQQSDEALLETWYSKWAAGHPRQHHECAVVDLTDGTWLSVSCGATADEYVCQSDGLAGDYVCEYEKTEPPKPRADWLIVMYCVVVGILLIIVVVIIMIVLYKRRRLNLDVIDRPRPEEPLDYPEPRYQPPRLRGPLDPDYVDPVVTPSGAADYGSGKDIYVNQPDRDYLDMVPTSGAANNDDDKYVNNTNDNVHTELPVYGNQPTYGNMDDTNAPLYENPTPRY